MTHLSVFLLLQPRHLSEAWRKRPSDIPIDNQYEKVYSKVLTRGREKNVFNLGSSEKSYVSTTTGCPLT